MHRLLPPLCLFMALAMLIAGFAMVMGGSPEASVEYHRARSTGDEQYADVLEAGLLRRQFARRVLLGGLFAGSAIMTGFAFFTMRPAEG